MLGLEAPWSQLAFCLPRKGCSWFVWLLQGCVVLPAKQPNLPPITPRPHPRPPQRAAGHQRGGAGAVLLPAPGGGGGVNHRKDGGKGGGWGALQRAAPAHRGGLDCSGARGEPATLHCTLLYTLCLRPHCPCPALRFMA